MGENSTSKLRNLIQFCGIQGISVLLNERFQWRRDKMFRSQISQPVPRPSLQEKERLRENNRLLSSLYVQGRNKVF